MPLFEVQCRGCEHEFETLIRNDKEWQELECPKCGPGTEIQRMLTAHKGYSIKGNNGASTRPKGAGSK